MKVGYFTMGRVINNWATLYISNRVLLGSRREPEAHTITNCYLHLKYFSQLHKPGLVCLYMKEREIFKHLICQQRKESLKNWDTSNHNHHEMHLKNVIRHVNTNIYLNLPRLYMKQLLIMRIFFLICVSKQNFCTHHLF